MASDYVMMLGAATRELHEAILRIAPTDLPVLVSGESGTGKEAVARALHEQSSRPAGPFVVVDCAGATEVESDRFGGAILLAEGGTLLLDEPGCLAPLLQSSLLRVLTHRAVEHVGQQEDRRTDIRVIAVTTRLLDRMVAEGLFREDLFYRLAVLQLHLRPLRQRMEDIGPLVRHYIDELAEQFSLPPLSISEDARSAILAHGWRGNLRELRDCARHALLRAEGPEITAKDLPPTVGTSTDLPQAGSAGPVALTFAAARERALLHFERDFLTAALRRHGGNISATARSLGLHRQSLQKLLRKLGLPGNGLDSGR